MKANAPWKEIKGRPYEAFRISSPGSTGEVGAAGPTVSGQSEDKRSRRRRRRRCRLPYVFTFALHQRYLLDYPVLINSSGFIFIFTTPRSRQPRGRTDRSFLRAEVGRGMTVANGQGRQRERERERERERGRERERQRERWTVGERAWSSTPSGTSWRSDGPLPSRIILTTARGACNSRYSREIAFNCLQGNVTLREYPRAVCSPSLIARCAVLLLRDYCYQRISRSKIEARRAITKLAARSERDWNK